MAPYRIHRLFSQHHANRPTDAINGGVYCRLITVEQG